MPSPYHQLASVPLAVDAASSGRRLTADVETLVSTATAGALTILGSRSVQWGLSVTELPTTTARTTGSDELGIAEVTWGGDEAATGWPALTGRLVVTPQAGQHARLHLLSPRTPHAELVTDRLDRLHDARIVNVSIGRFLQDLAHHLDGTAASTPTIGPGARAFDRSPMFVHHLQDLDVDPDTVRFWLLDQLQEVATAATDVTVSKAADTVAAGRFRAATRPRVEAWAAGPDEPATAWIRWVSDEEATGWPHLDLALLVEACPHGSRFTALSTREPSYDMSRLRIDKQQRNQLLQQAPADLAIALADALHGSAATTTGQGRPVAGSSVGTTVTP